MKFIIRKLDLIGICFAVMGSVVTLVLLRGRHFVAWLQITLPGFCLLIFVVLLYLLITYGRGSSSVLKDVIAECGYVEHPDSPFFSVDELADRCRQLIKRLSEIEPQLTKSSDLSVSHRLQETARRYLADRSNASALEFISLVYRSL